MSSKFSIITPVYRENALIGRFLAMIADIDGSDSAEVILVDGNEGSTIADVPDAPHRTMLISAPGRAHQMNRGAEVARGEFLAFVHVDTVLPRRALGLIERALETAPAGVFQLSISTTRRLVRFIGKASNLRNRLIRIPYGDQVHIFRRDYFNRIGGYREIPLMEDVEIMKRIKSLGDRIAILPFHVWTSDRRWSKEGVLWSVLRSSAILALYRIGVDPIHLSKLYRPHVEA